MNIACHTIAPAALSRRHYRACHLGLTAREVLVIDSLFRLHDDLQQHFVFAPCVATEPADIMFVDADKPDALAGWRAFSRAHPGATAIMVSAGGTDNGSAITLTRPLSFRHLDKVRAALHQATPQHDPASVADGHLQILVVDDSASARELLRLHLDDAAGSSRFPLCVDVAASGEDAVAMAAGKPYDLVFLDVVLPGMDGYDVCRAIKQQRPTRVAMLSSCGKPADYERGRAAGCDHYMAKPAPVDMVSAVLRLTSMKKAMPAH